MSRHQIREVQSSIGNEFERMDHKFHKLRMLSKLYLIVLISFIFIIYIREIVSNFQPARDFSMGLPVYAAILTISTLFLVVIAYLIMQSGSTTYRSTQEIYKQMRQEIAHYRSLSELLKEENQQLQVEASIDPLTNLYNRRAYNGFLLTLQNKIQESSSTISVIMIDVDCFKLYNDTYGHSEGDQVLVKIGKFLLELSSEYSCFAARFGGEEFVLILSNESEEVIERLCNHIREGVNDLNIPHQTSTIDIVVTVSVGACTKAITNVHEIDDCVSEADEALYFVKENGRNNFKYRNRIHA